MQPALISLIVSAGLLALIVQLFNKERTRGTRFLEDKRTRFDAAIERLYKVCERLSQPFRRDIMRHSLHYFFHQVLRSFKQFLRAVDTRLDALLRTNKALARKVTKEQSSSHLKEVAVHKAESALSPEEQKKQKERAIGTRL
ncbi:hypothetical protein KTR10_03585 [Candidatus Kaiserbacteria bacterium]|nr:hypothetical protein [Candidatus Kaiserbacteria bacterium]